MKEPVIITIPAKDYEIKWMHLAGLAEEFMGHIIVTEPPDESSFTIEFKDEDFSSAHAKIFLETLNNTFKKAIA